MDYEKSRRILLIAWWGGAVSCVSVISSMYFGLIENEEYYVATSGVIKNSLGFFNPNSVGLLSLSVFIIAMLAKSRLAVFSSALLFLFVAVNAMPRASLGLLLVFLLIILFCKTSDISVKRVALLIVWTFSFICISFFVFYDLWGLETNSAFFLMVDKFLSYRVSIAVHSESFTMANIFLPSPDFINFDLAFVTIVYNFGALLSYLFLFVLLLVIFCARRGDVDILLVSLTLMFSSLFVENIMYAYFALGVIGAAPLAMSLMYVLRSISPKNSPTNFGIKMKVIAISFSFSRGAAIAASKFSNILLEIPWVTLDQVKADSDVNEGGGVAYTIHLMKRIISYSLLKVMNDSNPVKHSLNIFSSRSLLKCFRSQGKDLELVFNFHWLNNDLLSVFRFSSFPKCSVITLHDEWLYCGAEHYVDIESGDMSFRDGYRFFNRKILGLNWNYIIWRLKLRSLRGRNDIIFTVPSSWMLQRASSSLILKGKDVRLMPNPIPTDIFIPASDEEKRQLREKFGLSGNDVLICLGAVNGKLNPLKGYDLAEKALASLNKKLSQDVIGKVCLVFFGHGDFERGYFQGVRMINVGKVSGASAMRDIYAMCDWTLVPSKVEAFGQVAAESLACETPVIAFNTSGLKDVVKDRVSGFLAEPFNCDDYADCIMSALMMDSDCYLEMSRAGRSHIEESFSTLVVKESYLSVLNDSLMRKRELMEKER
ncbi:glycosyltransferase [Halomonas sp. E19]|uniref:glycosyltransferase n=1 Tax=Halomonas sp. E19 TaxID=3397247 RepID=UPI0040336AF6